MRAIHFMMIDYIKVKQQVYFMPLFLVIALLMWGQGYSILVPFSYMMFVAIIFSTAPFGACKKGDAGFLVLLPSTVMHRVMGRFLYGLSFCRNCGDMLWNLCGHSSDHGKRYGSMGCAGKSVSAGLWYVDHHGGIPDYVSDRGEYGAAASGNRESGTGHGELFCYDVSYG